MQNNIYIKIPKEFVTTNMNTKSKKGLLIAYLFFHTTYDKEIYTSIDCICSELKMSTNSHGARRSQNVIKELLSELITEKIISFIPTKYCGSFVTIANNQLFKIKFNHEAEIFNLESHYVRIEKYEYDAILSINNQQINKIFNIFYQIKSYVCMDEGCLHICYPSIQTLCRLCGCSNSTLSNIIKILYQHKMIYLYRFNNQEKIKINRNIEYVFALDNYSRQEVYSEFAVS